MGKRRQHDGNGRRGQGKSRGKPRVRTRVVVPGEDSSDNARGRGKSKKTGKRKDKRKSAKTKGRGSRKKKGGAKTRKVRVKGARRRQKRLHGPRKTAPSVSSSSMSFSSPGGSSSVTTSSTSSSSSAAVIRHNRRDRRSVHKGRRRVRQQRKTREPRKGLSRKPKRPKWVLRPNDDGAFHVHWGSIRRYKFGVHLGSGAFGDVFCGREKATGTVVAIKEMKDEPQERIRTYKEMNALLRVHDGPNIVRLYDTCRDRHHTNYLVFEYIDEDRWQSLYPQLTDLDIRFYIYKLLLALSYTHRRNVIHRDVKPSNVIIDHGRGRLRLVDWGCAGVWSPGKSFTRFPGTRPYKAPETLLHVHQYNAAVDMWGVGVILGMMMFKKRTFFTSMGTDEEQLGAISRLLGTDPISDYCDRVGIEHPRFVRRAPHKAVSFRSMVDDDNFDTVTSAGLNVLRKLLVVDPARRITANEALDLPYFDPVRERADDETDSDSSECLDDPGFVPLFRDQDIQFGVGFDKDGPSSWVGYSTQDSDSGFFDPLEGSNEEVRRWQH